LPTPYNKNILNPICSTRSRFLISPMFKVVNTISNYIYGTMESSMQIKFIYQLFPRWFKNEMLPALYRKGTMVI
jgi:hypothetical protein